MGEIALNKKPTAEDFEYAYVENSAGEIVRVTKEKILALGIANINKGQPINVSLVSAMTDTNAIYLYTGTEEGYTKGHWYYYDGTTWMDGGLYGGKSSGVSWTDAQITLLETLGNYIAFSDNATGQAIFDNLIKSLRNKSADEGSGDDNTGGETGGGGSEIQTYSITNSLADCTSNNDATSITSGESYTATLIATDGYYIDSVVVTMGGINVTDTVYADKVITISEVTGNIVIIANAKKTDNLITEYHDGANELMPDGAQAISGTFMVTSLIPVSEYENTTLKTNIGRLLADGSINWNQKAYYLDSAESIVRTVALTGDNRDAFGTMLDIDVPSGASYVKFMFHVSNTTPYYGESGVV